MWENKKWKCPGEDLSIDINLKLKELSNKRVFIGCDSKEKNKNTIFACVIIHDRKYYYTKILLGEFKSYHDRLREEVNIVMSLAFYVFDVNPNLNLELHYDISQNPKMFSNKILRYASSYAESCNFKWKAKPNAWASTDIADWHTK